MFQQDKRCFSDRSLYFESSNFEFALRAGVVPLCGCGIKSSIGERSCMKLEGLADGCRPVPVVFVLAKLKLDERRARVREASLLVILADVIAARSDEPDH